MKKNTGMNIFGVIVCQLLFLANLAHGLFTWGICAEQIETGWGYGTNWEMGALYPWMVEFLSLPVILCGIVYLLSSIWKKSEKVIFIFASVLFGAELLQIFVLNLFVIF